MMILFVAVDKGDDYMVAVDDGDENIIVLVAEDDMMLPHCCAP